MSEKLSTGLRDFLLCRGCVRDFLSDCKMNIYSGTPPASANDAITGYTRLVTITKEGGTTYNRDGWGEIETVTITSHGAETFVFDVTIGSETKVTTRIYDNTIDAGGVEDVAVRCVKLFNEIGCRACATGTDGIIYIMAPSRKSMLIAKNSGMTGTCSFGTGVYVADANGDLLNFGPASNGSMPKTSDTWSGLIATSGVAGFFRLVQADDDGNLSTSQIRAQGAISTSGAELNMANTSLVAGHTHTVDNYSFTLPAE